MQVGFKRHTLYRRQKNADGADGRLYPIGNFHNCLASSREEVPSALLVPPTPDHGVKGQINSPAARLTTARNANE